MTRAAHCTALTWRLRVGVLATRVACGLALVWSAHSVAQGPVAPKPAAIAVSAEQGARWADLKPAQRSALQPLEHEWPGIDLRSKRKWLELSARFPKLTPPEQARVQERMTAWAKLTTRERTEARMHFQEAKQLPVQDRQERWKAYEALSPEQKQQLAARAAPAASEAARHKALPAGMRNERNDKGDKGARESLPQAKSNIVPNPAYAAAPKAVAPTVVQARPGATTTLITKRPSPPGHQQTGLPKIAATPGFVNEATLLPQRGPQAAATRSASAPAPEARPRQ